MSEERLSPLIPGRQIDSQNNVRRAVATEHGTEEIKMTERPQLSEAGEPVEVHGPRPNDAHRQTYRMRLRQSVIDVPFWTRGNVDRSIIHDLWERDEYGVRALGNLSPKVILDIGAHIRIFTSLAKGLWPDALIIACEADPENASLLRTNLAGQKGIEVIEAAIVSENVPKAEFFAIPDKSKENSGGGSCNRPEPGSIRIRVAALPLSQLWHQRLLGGCDLLKLDCKGGELPLLRFMAQERLLSEVGHIVAEWHAIDSRPATTNNVRHEIAKLLAETHIVRFGATRPGHEGHLSAQRRR